MGQSADHVETFVDMADDLRLNATISSGDIDAVEIELEDDVMEESSPQESCKDASTHSGAARSKLRSGVRLNRAARSCVETGGDEEDPTLSKTKAEHIRAKHIVKIFLEDKDNFIEVSPEQLRRVRTMHKKIEDGASFSFNYNILLIVASILAGLGLVSNSSTNIIASMLVSPIMGPVVGLGKSFLFSLLKIGVSFQTYRAIVRRTALTITTSLLLHSLWNIHSRLKAGKEVS